MYTTYFRRGSVLIYSVFLMVLLLALASLAVDFGRMQMIKTQMQRSADATARGTLQMYISIGSSNAVAYGPGLAGNGYNPTDAGSGVQPTVVLTWGSWNATARTFTAGTGTPMAVMVTVSRTAANGNAVPLTFPLLNGITAVKTTCDISATAIATMSSGSTTNSTVPGTANVWLSGMPAGSNASWTDSPANAAPVMALNVTPGTTITFNAGGYTGYSGNNPNIFAWGASYNTTHMQGSPDGNYNGLQNGIQTLTAPQNALIGVFLTNAAPNTLTPPATALTYTSSSEAAQEYNSLQLQQPFYIGPGYTFGFTTQTFVVPAGATRLYLGVFDGWQNNDNPGSLAVITTLVPQVSLVK